MTQKMIESVVHIIENKKIVNDFYLLKLKYSGLKPFPGQFVNLEAKNFLLKRPFAVFDYEPGVLTLMYRIVGDGTKSLAAMNPGDALEILCPLGKGFEITEAPSFLMGGGTGIASLYYLAKELKNLNMLKTIFLGGNTKAEVFAFMGLFDGITNDIKVSTMDRTFGFFGNAVEMTRNYLKMEKDYNLYACGPHAMLKSLGSAIEGKELAPENTYISMEARMGCGFGVCLGCAVTRKNSTDFAYVCKDGPVFRIEEIDLNA